MNPRKQGKRMQVKKYFTVFYNIKYTGTNWCHSSAAPVANVSTEQMILESALGETNSGRDSHVGQLGLNAERTTSTLQALGNMLFYSPI